MLWLLLWDRIASGAYAAKVAESRTSKSMIEEEDVVPCNLFWCVDEGWWGFFLLKPVILDNFTARSIGKGNEFIWYSCAVPPFILSPPYDFQRKDYPPIPFVEATPTRKVAPKARFNQCPLIKLKSVWYKKEEEGILKWVWYRKGIEPVRRFGPPAPSSNP
jgi:hypothetical protein